MTHTIIALPSWPPPHPQTMASPAVLPRCCPPPTAKAHARGGAPASACPPVAPLAATGGARARGRFARGAKGSRRGSGVGVRAAGPKGNENEELVEMCRVIDDNLSNRPLNLDPSGYFIIRVDKVRGVLVAEHFANTIDDDGVACDPATGEPIPCDGSYKPRPVRVYEGRTAKDVSVKVLEGGAAEGTPACTMLVHANYLGRELQKAEQCLLHGGQYWQD
mmetsp:Transcript_26929/g.86540  ORF Transcript_26929/g.86540 Transcript_26929/m.86540 type:complete len:220 (+) Transcript_26929:619-1278(+)